MGASSGEWRSEATPTMHCEALWTLGLKVFLQEIKEYSLKNIFSGFCDANSEENIHNI